jgi:hypothetical protein
VGGVDVRVQREELHRILHRLPASGGYGGLLFAPKGSTEVIEVKGRRFIIRSLQRIAKAMRADGASCLVGGRCLRPSPSEFVMLREDGDRSFRPIARTHFLWAGHVRFRQCCAVLSYATSAVSLRDSSLSRSQVKITGVTISTCSRELTMPPRTGVASGFRATPSDLASTARNRLCASFARSPDHLFQSLRQNSQYTDDTQSVGSFGLPTAIYRALRCDRCLVITT